MSSNAHLQNVGPRSAGCQSKLRSIHSTQNASSLPPLPFMGQKFLCDCKRYCNGGRQVSRSTYYHHKPYRHQLAVIPLVPEDSDKRRRIEDNASGLLSLPTELLREIFAEYANESTSLWSHKFCRRSLYYPRLSSQVESLVKTEPKPTSASKYATKLRIGHLCPSPDEKGVISFEEAKIRSFLLSAISSLVGVRQIIWDLGEYDPEWATLLVTDALASLPALEDLHLSVWLAPDSPCVQFQRLSNLKKFTFISDFSNRTAVIRTVAGLIGWNQPELTSITIVNDGYYSGGYAPTLQDFLAETSSSVCLKITHLNLSGLFVKFDAGALRHLRSLISLTIMNISSPYDETTEYQGPEFSAQKIWSTLRSEKIHLQELVTDNAQPALVEYLTSFSGLKECGVLENIVPT
ncbi:uncharacterized protein LACBIDRAFT_307044 [Laccaria bicolor S238N-H82]|uniref:Predicted protein n=1 Tax=Laccaria bicolor (strain S238N-H82 / ATCC MYA-4686) TaxID=486041 RepID=B0DP86_LACBS|nr:uncharacterized protein LACBIDRAFT_307044 [Laccaria bicolor S238N-H82]EDR03571.1 predicted protein [Laccaria bicolor S238N-H82]|eukprot:XP_001885719.1 predicted protein [Laccaria bicolor S238N-H82]